MKRTRPAPTVAEGLADWDGPGETCLDGTWCREHEIRLTREDLDQQIAALEKTAVHGSAAQAELSLLRFLRGDS